MTWQEKLIRRYPNLFLRAFRGVAFAPAYPRCDDGWQDVVSRLVERVAAASSDGTIYFTHMVAEHGALRVHWKPLRSRRLVRFRRVQSAGPRVACSRAASASLRLASSTKMALLCRLFPDFTTFSSNEGSFEAALLSCTSDTTGHRTPSSTLRPKAS